MDDIDAIEDAFAAVGLPVPWDHATTWATVGDVWKSVRRMAPEIGASSEAWDKFRRGIAHTTGVDWTRVAEGTSLLDGRGAHPLYRMWTSAKEWFASKRS